MSISTTLSAAPGGTVTVPVNIDNADGLNLVDLLIGYDSTVMDVVGVRVGTVASGAMLVTNPTDPTNAAGTIAVGLVLPAPHGPGGGSLLEVDYHIKPTALAGPTLIDLRQVSLNQGMFALTPTPVPGPDPTDGLITILSDPQNLASVPSVGAADSTLATVTPTVTPVNAVPLLADAAPNNTDNFGIRNAKFEIGRIEGLDNFAIRNSQFEIARLRRPPSEGSAPLFIDWSSGFKSSEVGEPKAGAPTILPVPRPWVRPFLLELAVDKTANPNRDIRIELPNVEEILPAVSAPL